MKFQVHSLYVNRLYKQGEIIPENQIVKKIIHSLPDKFVLKITVAEVKT